MESIQELRKICQTTAKKDRSNVYMRYVSRFFSIYLTRLLLPTPVTPNQVSLAMIVTGVAATFFFLCPSRGVFFAGALLLQFWYILDCMDGEVARYRQYKSTQTVITDKRSSGMTGTYYDVLNHYIINLLVPATLGYGLFKLSGSSFYVLLGVFGAVGQTLILAMNDGGHRVTLAHIKKYKRLQINSTESLKTDESPKKRSLPHILFMSLHYMMTYPTVMNLVLIAALLNYFIPALDWRFLLLWFVTIGTLLVVTTIITRNILNRTLENDFRRDFQILDDVPA